MSDLVEIRTIIPDIRLDLRYATTNNFTHRVLYPVAKAFLIPEVADNLKHVQDELRTMNLEILVWDAYRPLSITKYFHEVTPPAQHKYVANPEKGSIHNRGCALDVTLIDLHTDTELEMTSAFDTFNATAFADFQDATEAAIRNRKILIDIMDRHGFIVNPYEWWHFNWHAWQLYPVLDIPIEAL